MIRQAGPIRPVYRRSSHVGVYLKCSAALALELIVVTTIVTIGGAVTQLPRKSGQRFVGTTVPLAMAQGRSRLATIEVHSANDPQFTHANRFTADAQTARGLFFC
jgi:hypothetical protein